MSMLVLVLCLLAAPDGPAVVYQPPLDAPVVDPFRAPANPYAAGNRGLEYATIVGSAVGSVADGVVVFAGPVAGYLHVTVLHADGIRTSYSFLQEILVSKGQRVARGQPVGTTGARFHLGARAGPRQYIDPASLWSAPPHVFLVPEHGDDAAHPPTGPGGDATELAAVVAAPVPPVALIGGVAELGATGSLR